MSKRIEDYGLIGNMLSGALVGRDGSIDWLCLPRFDSDACFAALLGTPGHGYWRIAPVGNTQTSRAYLPHTPIIETTFETPEGKATLVDFMPLSDDPDIVDVIRLVRGVSGRVRLRMDLALRFGYGKTVPWVRRRDYGVHAVAGPDAVELVTPVPLRGEDMQTVAEFEVAEGDVVPFTLAYHPQHRDPHFIGDARIRLDQTASWWRAWTRSFELPDDGGDPVLDDAMERSLITLKALTYAPSGAVVAALTTSLPEELGGIRNWDYRYCWIRDAAMTLYALTNAGCFGEASAFREWLLRAAAGAPEQMQIMYGVSGERRLPEIELPWLPGYEGSRPVRIGNGAYEQVQIDVFGELMDAFHVVRKSHLGPNGEAWRFLRAMLSRLEGLWREPDEGIWEVRGGRRHFVHSKMMAWVAFDRAIKAVEQSELSGPVDRWRATRDEIHREVLARGYDADRNTFVQHYGGGALDASLLLMATVGFLPPEDSRFRGTVEAIERELVEGGLVLRYRTEDTDDGLAGGEGGFLVCSFWLADAYTMIGRQDDAQALLDRLLTLRNDLGLLAEEYHPGLGRQLGNFPQAFSHIGLINTVHNLRRARGGPAEQRADRGATPRADAGPAERSGATGPQVRPAG